MQNKIFLFLLILSFIFLSFADVPMTVNYQGKLFDSGTGGPIDGTKAIGYRLYKDIDNDHIWDDPGDSLVWEQIPANETVDNGLFNDTLDFSTGYMDYSGESGPTYDFASVFGGGKDLFLRVYVGDAGSYSDFTGTSALDSPEPFRSTPYAFYASQLAGGGNNLQDAYNRSGTTNPQITIDETNGSFKVGGGSVAEAAIYASSDANNTPAIYGYHSTSGTGDRMGVRGDYGTSGVRGYLGAQVGGTNVGVYGQYDSKHWGKLGQASKGIEGHAETASATPTDQNAIYATVDYTGAGTMGNEYGVRIIADINNGTGTITNQYGLHSETKSSDGTVTNTYGIYATVSGATSNYAVYGRQSTSSNYGYLGGDIYGVFGSVNNAGEIGVYGVNTSTAASGNMIGVRGAATGSGGETSVHYGIYGEASGGGTNYAGYFDGNAQVTGQLTLGSGDTDYDFPSTRGSTGEILKLNDSGVLIWATDAVNDDDHSTSNELQNLFNRVQDNGGTNTYTVSSQTDILRFNNGTNTTVSVSQSDNRVNVSYSVTGLDNYVSWTAHDNDDEGYTITSSDVLKFAEGSGIDVNFTDDDVLTITHKDLSDQSSVNNSDGTVIQDVTLDWTGHVTGLTSVNLDSRYLTSYTETDPQVGSNTLNYVPKWNGSALVTGTIYDNGNVGIGTPSPQAELDVNGIIRANHYRDNGGGNLIRSDDGSITVTEDADGSWNLTDAGGGSNGNFGINVETLTGDKTLQVGTDEMYQYLDPNGANRDITLSTSGASAGDRFIIRNNGSYNSDDALITYQGGNQLDWIYAGGIKEFIFDGTNWVSASNGTGENDDKKYNVSLGYRTKAYTHGTAIGYSAQGFSYGTGIGEYADGHNHGVAVGRYADADGYGTALGDHADGHSSGVAIGYHTGDGITSGSGNILIGYSAGDNLTSGSNNIIIGYNIDAQNAAGNNQMSIGNLIFATGIDGEGTTVSSGNVGIGEPNPSHKLVVAGDAGFNDYLYHNDDDNTYIYFTPDRIQFYTGGRSMIDVQYSDNEVAINEGGTQTDFRVEGGTDDHLLFTDGSTDRVGIGTSSPSDGKLVVSYDNTDIPGIYVTTPGWAIYGDASGANGRGVMGTGGEYGILGTHLTTDRMGYIASEDYGVYGEYDNATYGYLGGSSYGVYGRSSNAAGDAGVYAYNGGSTNWAALAYYSGSAYYAGYFHGDVNIDGDLTVTGSYPGGGGSADQDWFEVGGTTPPDNIADNMYHTGNVGIGTTNPGGVLDIGTPDGSSHDNGLVIKSGGDYRVDLQFREAGTSNVMALAYRGDFGLGDGNAIAIQDEGGNALVTFKRSGNVGIGTTNPLSKLSVGGDGDANYAIYGTGSAYGVYGHGTSYGVYGHYSSGRYGYIAGQRYAIYGKFDEDATGLASTYAGYFVNENDENNSSYSKFGVYGDVNADYGTKYAIYGSSEGDGTNYGVYGKAFDGTTNYGGYFDGTTYGVYGKSTNWAGYFDGNVKITEDLTVAGGNLTIGTIDITGSGTSYSTSGAYVIGAYDEFTNSDATNVQDVLDDLDQAITDAGSSQWTYVTDAGDDYIEVSTGSNPVKIYVEGTKEGKIDAKTVDPVIEIAGKQYATYCWDGIGLRTDVVGEGQLENGVFELHLDQQPEASDLWLFYNVVAENTIVPFVTPQDEAYLMARMEGSVLIVKAISGDMNARFSFRLSAKRIDMAGPTEEINIRTDNPGAHIRVEDYDKNGNPK